MITGLVTSRNREALKVGTPLATIGIRGTEFIAELVNPLFVQVIAGSITATNAGGVVVFTAGQIGSVATANALGGIVPPGQVPAGVFQMPNVPLSAAPGAIPSGTAVGGGVGAGAGAGAGTAAIAIGAAAVAGVLIATENETSTTHH